MSGSLDVLADLLGDGPDPDPIEDVAAWWTSHRPVAVERTPADAALIGGYRADRLAWAFASGYQAAGRALFGAVETRLGALCATEAKGNHPRAIETTLEGGRLSGQKSFVTLGRSAEVLYVVARAGDRAGRPVLEIVRVDPSARGISWIDTTETPFVPEISHAAIRFDAVAVPEDAVLPGDGYTDYLKPFRTVEDAHVLAAFSAHLLGIAIRYDVGREVAEELSALVLTLHALCSGDPKAPAGHLALAGAFAQARQIAADAHFWTKVDAAVRERFDRDRAILSVAERARARRTEVAWDSFAHPGR